MGTGQFSINVPSGNPSIFYQDKFTGRKFTLDSMREYMAGVRAEFDRGYNLIMDGGISIVSYSIILCRNGMDWNTMVGKEIFNGGFDVSVHGSDFCLHEFRDNYTKTIESIIKDMTAPAILNGDVYLIAFEGVKGTILDGFVPDKL